MAGRFRKKASLSKGILEMKFMQRSKEKVENEIMEEQSRTLLRGDITNAAKTGTQYVIEPSYVNCEGLIFGRMSFKGANPEIEKIMKNYDASQKEKEIVKIETEGSVSDEEMASRYSTLIGTMGKKFLPRKRKFDETNSPAPKNDKSKPNKPKTFLKPTDE